MRSILPETRSVRPSPRSMASGSSRWGSPVADSRETPKAELEVGRDRALPAVQLALEPLAQVGLEAGALLLPQGGEPRRARPHQGVEVLVGQLVQAAAHLRTVAERELAAVAPLAQELLRHLVEDAAALERIEARAAPPAPPPARAAARTAAGTGSRSARTTARRLAEMGRAAVTGSSLRAISAASSVGTPSRGAKATRPS